MSLADMRVGNLFFNSMRLTRLAETPASPMSRSTASGGQVDMRNVERISGCLRMVTECILVKFSVERSVALTSLVVRIRVVLKAFGANLMNQRLYISTDLAISAFHCSGLSELTATLP